MSGREFIKGSAIPGLSLATTNLLVAHSGMYHAHAKRKIYRILNANDVSRITGQGKWGI